MSKRNIYNLGCIANFLSAELVGNAEVEIWGIGSLTGAKTGQISFLQDSVKYGKYLLETLASAVIIRKSDLKISENIRLNFVVVSDPYLAYAKISSLFYDTPELAAGIHATAIIGENCDIASSVSIGPNVVIGNRVKIGSRVVVEPGCVIGDDCTLNADTRLYSKVVLYRRVAVGLRALIHSGAVIGADGFGNANVEGTWHKIHQLGAVIIGNDVEIGANTTIDRGAIDDTIIGNGVKIDNQVQIGHNVSVGDHTAIAGCVGIAGSTKIGKHCMIGGKVGIAGHLEIVNDVIITGMSSIAKSITKSGIYASAIPAIPHRTWWRAIFHLMQLEKLIERIKRLEMKIL